MLYAYGPSLSNLSQWSIVLGRRTPMLALTQTKYRKVNFFICDRGEKRQFSDKGGGLGLKGDTLKSLLGALPENVVV